jgi:hypothetical protein
MTPKPLQTTTEFIADLDKQIAFIERRIIQLEEQRLHGWVLTYRTHLQSFKRLREAWAKIQKDEYRNEIYFK